MYFSGKYYEGNEDETNSQLRLPNGWDAACVICEAASLHGAHVRVGFQDGFGARFGPQCHPTELRSAFRQARVDG